MTIQMLTENVQFKGVAIFFHYKTLIFFFLFVYTQTVILAICIVLSFEIRLSIFGGWYRFAFHFTLFLCKVSYADY